MPNSTETLNPLKFCQSGEISPNLIALATTLADDVHFSFILKVNCKFDNEDFFEDYSNEDSKSLDSINSQEFIDNIPLENFELKNKIKSLEKNYIA